MIELEIEDAVGWVRLARPEARNALDRPLLAALHDAVRRAARTPGVRCLVLAGTGPSFCAGGDLAAVRVQSVPETLALNRLLLDVANTIEGLTIPTVAALHGDALGGGLELALACTLRVAATDARLGLPEVRLGLIPGGGGIGRLAPLVGRGAARYLLLTGAVVSAPRAAALGLVDQVGDAGAAGATAAARQVATTIAANGPLAVRAVRDVLRASEQATVASAVAQAEAALPAVLGSADAREGVEAFAQRRSPTFTGT